MSEKQASYNAGETETIKPCPFCGEPKTLDKFIGFGDTSVICKACNAAGPSASNTTDAVLLWNAAANALEAAKHECDNLREACLGYSQIQASLVEQRDEVIAERDEAKRIAALRLKDCETMANEVEKYKAERDEARAWARKLWREKQAEKQCPACRGDGYVIVDIMGYSNGRMQKCFFCNGTGKVTK